MLALQERSLPTIALLLQALFLAVFMETINDENDIYNHILSGYNREVRPVLNSGDAVSVELTFYPSTLLIMNERDQVMNMHGMLVLSWNDPFLGWNSSIFGNVTELPIDFTKIWTPSIGLHNSADKIFDPALTEGGRLSVYSSGFVVWSISGEYRVTCRMDVTYFPFDSQACSINVTSWAYPKHILVLGSAENHTKMVTALYSENGLWELKDTLIEVCTITPVQFKSEGYSHVAFTFYLKRKIRYHLFSVVGPLIMTILLVPVVFLLPGDSGDKVYLSITILLTLSIFLLSLKETTPTTSDYTPIITIFITFQMAITVLSIVFSTVILQIHFSKSARRPSKITRFLVFGCLAPLFCLGEDVRSSKVKDPKNRRHEGVQQSLMVLKHALEEKVKFTYDAKVDRLFKYLQVMIEKIRADQEESDISKEWRKVAYVLEWVFFWLNFFVIMLGTFLIYLKPLLQIP